MTNLQVKGEIVHHNISDFALNQYVGLSMALILIFESANPSLFRDHWIQSLEILAQGQTSLYVCYFFAQCFVIIITNQYITGKQTT